MTATDAPIVGPSYLNSPPTKASLTSWWERFRKKNSSLEGKDSLGGHGIFGVPLHESIKYANVAINVTDANGESQVYGYVPVVVAKCGVYLKEKATNVEGIFRLSGSAKRIKDLQTVFDTPDTYGKGLDWSGYTVHDAANVLRRYLNQLPEPIVPLEFYTRFRDPLTINPDTFDEAHAIKVYQNLIMQLPDLNRQLLLYILDLLAVFASKSDQNLMTANNLAAIFQPGLISHPSHEMAPSAYKLSQDVLVFLITHQDHFLLGTYAKGHDIAPPLPPQTPTSLKHSKTVVARAPSGASSASTGKTLGSLRRNASTGSRKSRSSGGVSRSNTLPIRKSPRPGPSAHFRPSAPSDTVQSSPKAQSLGPPLGDSTTSPGVILNLPSERDSSPAGRLTEAMSPIEPPTNMNLNSGAHPARSRAVERPRQVSGSFMDRSPAVSPPPKERKDLGNLFGLAASDRPGRKLRKRLPEGNNPSAHSSTSSLPVDGPSPVIPVTLDTVPGSPPQKPEAPVAQRTPHSPPQKPEAPVAQRTPHSPPLQSARGAVVGSNGLSVNSSSTLMPTMSPTSSATSSVTSQESLHSMSDVTNTSASPKKESRLRSHWKRLSGGGKVHNWEPPLSPTFTQSNGSIAERIRRESRSPPALNSRKSYSEGSGDEARSTRSSLSWLAKGFGGKRSQDDRSRSRDRLNDASTTLDTSGSVQSPGTPSVQPPTPAAIEPKVSPIKESLLERMESESDTVTPQTGTNVATPKGEKPIVDNSPLITPEKMSTASLPNPPQAAIVPASNSTSSLPVETSSKGIPPVGTTIVPEAAR